MAVRFAGPVVFVVSLCPRPSLAHKGDFVLPVYELPTSELPDLHDGTLEDWEAVVPGPSMDHRMAWSAEGFVVRRPRPPGVARVPGLALEVAAALPGHRARGRRVPRGRPTHGGPDRFRDRRGSQRRAVSRPRPEGTRGRRLERQEYHVVFRALGASGSIAVAMGGFGSLWPMQEPWLESGYAHQGEAPGRFVLEVSVTPWDELDLAGPEGSRRSKLRPNAFIGLQVILYDKDGGLDVEVQQLTAPGCGPCREAPGAHADTAADAQLIPCQVRDCSGHKQEPTSVAADSWARVKASFR